MRYTKCKVIRWTIRLGPIKNDGHVSNNFVTLLSFLKALRGFENGGSERIKSLVNFAFIIRTCSSVNRPSEFYQHSSFWKVLKFAVKYHLIRFTFLLLNEKICACCSLHFLVDLIFKHIRNEYDIEYYLVRNWSLDLCNSCWSQLSSEQMVRQMKLPKY